ncbi:peptidoglycan DD-metalloendopeptidase family protein [Eubacteriaceae bacterium ES3]|nr:peptidoglycan DD-metalloendopeptidase family protein [Eubacteriaceae bacterium ES3]
MLRRKVSSIFLTIAMVLSVLSPAVNAATLDEQLEESQQKQAEAQYQVDLTQSTIDGIEAEITKANEEITRINGVIDGLTAEIKALEEKIAKTEAELEVIQEKLTEQEDAMNERVRTMYMYGNGSILEFLFNATDFSDFITKVDMSRYIVESDKDSLDALEATRKEIDEKKKSIEADREAVVEKKTEQETALSQQESIKAQKDELLAQNQALIEQYKAIVDAEATNAANIQAQIQAALQQQASNGGSYSFTPTEGTYQWPVPGYYPTASDDFFGTRLHPIWGTYLTHYGVDCAAPSGTPIHAMGNATVISAGWNGGYGNCVIIDMGNGVQALYGHMSSIAVSSGQTISKGDVVGYVGSTGDSTGAHLHFGVLQNGSYVDPLGYF